MKFVRFVVVVSLWLTASLCHAQLKADLSGPMPGEPDHLVPINPHPPVVLKDYQDLWRDKLQTPAKPEAAVMVFLPSFTPEECLVIHQSGEDQRTYTLIHTRADQNLWNSRRNVEVKRREAKLSPELAERVCRVWDKMLRGVRYPIPSDDELMLDGETIEFWRKSMYGETSSPTGGAPKGLVDLGRALIDYCDASDKKKADSLRNVEKQCQSLERYLDRKVTRPDRP